MIFGAVGIPSRVGDLVTQLASELGKAPIYACVRGATAIAAWEGVPSPCASGTCAYVGRIDRMPPGPGEELRGDFAWVSRSGGGLRLARGAFTGRPLHWLRISGAVVACSRLLPLALLERRNLQLNIGHLLAFFDPGLDSPPPFQGVQSVPLNAVVDIDESGNARTSSGPVHVGKRLDLHPRDLVRAFRSELEQAVARQTAGARRVAVMTGGGVDSSALLALAVRNHREFGGPEVVPVAYDIGGPGDDRPHLRTLCHHLCVEPVRTNATSAPYARPSNILDASAYPVSLSPAISLFRGAQNAGADLGIFGTGAEYTLEPSSDVFGDFLLRAPLRALACLATYRMLGRSRSQMIRFLLPGPIWRRVAPAPVRQSRARYLRQRSATQRVREHPWFGPRLVAHLATDRPVAPPIHDQRSRVLALPQFPFLKASIGLVSRLEASVGVPIAYPYLDDDFVRFTARISSADVFIGERERGLLRESMAGLVPDSLRYRMDKAVGDQPEREQFLAAGGYQAVADLATMRELDRIGIVRARRFQQEFRAFSDDPDSWSSRSAIPFWLALHAEVFARWFRSFVSTETKPIDQVSLT